MTYCKFDLAEDCCSASSVLIPTPKEIGITQSRCVTINIPKNGKKLLTCPLHCCSRCVKFMKEHPGHVSTDDILGYVSVKKFDLYRKWSEISCKFHHDGYVVLNLDNKVFEMMKVKTGDTGEFLNMLADKNLFWQKLFTNRIKGDERIPLELEKKRQWIPVYSDGTAVEGKRYQEECKSSEYASSHDQFIKQVVSWLVFPDLCLWMHAIGNPLSASEKSCNVWDHYMNLHGDLAQVSGLNLLTRAVGMKWDQNLHIDSPYGNVFLMQPQTNNYKFCVLPKGNHLDWLDKTPFAKTGEDTQERVDEKSVVTLLLNKGDLLISFDCTPHAGGCSSHKIVEEGDNLPLFNFLQKQWLKGGLVSGTSDVAFQSHIKIGSESLSYGGAMKCSNTKTYNQLQRIKGSEEVARNTTKVLEKNKEMTISSMFRSQYNLFPQIQNYYKDLKNCKQRSVQVEWNGIMTNTRITETIASDSLKQASVTNKGSEGRKRKKST